VSNASREDPVTKTIEIVVNGEPRAVPDGLDMFGLLQDLKINPERVAVELNRLIVRKPDWSAVRIAAGDQIEIVWFVGGG
jgi:thiamine biosynthesis protein ThiS